MTIFNPYSESSARVPTALDPRRPIGDPRRPPGDPERRYRSGLLTAVGLFLVVASLLVPAALATLVQLAVVLCEGHSSPVCGDGSLVTNAGIVIPAAAGIVALVLTGIGRGSVRRTHNATGAILLILAAGVLVVAAILVRDLAGLPIL